MIQIKLNLKEDRKPEFGALGPRLGLTVSLLRKLVLRAGEHPLKRGQPVLEVGLLRGRSFVDSVDKPDLLIVFMMSGSAISKRRETDTRTDDGESCTSFQSTHDSDN